MNSKQTKAAKKIAQRSAGQFVAALADQVFVAYAAPGGKTESFCKKVLGWGKPLLTFNSSDNASLLASGARPFNLDAFTGEVDQGPFEDFTDGV